MRSYRSNIFSGGREARFLVSLETGRWWKGAPEQLCAYAIPSHSTTLLGLSKFNQHAAGTSQLGYRKPHKFYQDTRPLLYNLADGDHVRAFYRTFQHLFAYAAGMQQGPNRHRYSVPLGGRRVLCTTPITLRREEGGYEDYEGKEILEVLCENANYRTPSRKCEANNADIRSRAKEEWYRKCSPQRAYRFRIRRVLTKGNDELRGYTINECSELTVPLGAAEKLAGRLPELLQYVWDYTLRNPDQVTTRRDHEDVGAREQLHRLPAFEQLLVPKLQKLQYRAQWELFRHRSRRRSIADLQERAKLPLYEVKAAILTLVLLWFARKLARSPAARPRYRELGAERQLAMVIPVRARPRGPP